MNAISPIPPVVAHCPEPERLWSLWDMIRGSLTGLGPLLYKLTLYETLNWRGDRCGSEAASQKIKDDVQGWLKVAATVASDFELMTALRLFSGDFGRSLKSVGMRSALNAGCFGKLLRRRSQIALCICTPKSKAASSSGGRRTGQTFSKNFHQRLKTLCMRWIAGRSATAPQACFI